MGCAQAKVIPTKSLGDKVTRNEDKPELTRGSANWPKYFTWSESGAMESLQPGQRESATPETSIDDLVSQFPTSSDVTLDHVSVVSTPTGETIPLKKLDTPEICDEGQPAPTAADTLKLDRLASQSLSLSSRRSAFHSWKDKFSRMVRKGTGTSGTPDPEMSRKLSELF